MVVIYGGNGGKSSKVGLPTDVRNLEAQYATALWQWLL